MLSQTGFHTAVWVTLGVAAAMTVVAAAVYLSGGARLYEPDLDSWLTSPPEAQAVAIQSPPLGSAFK
jgi:hypothetical protein